MGHLTRQQIEALVTIVVVVVALFWMFPRRPRW
jgi:hypothetical protein